MPYILTRRVRTSQPQQAIGASAAFGLKKSLVSFIHGGQLSSINGPQGAGTAVGLVDTILSDGLGSKFNGSDTSNYYDYPSSLFYQSGSNNTVVFGVVFNAYQSGFIIYEAGTGKNNYGVLSPASSSSSVITQFNANVDKLTTKNNFELGRLYKFCITCNASQASIYIDGEWDSDHTISLPFSNATAVSTLGRHKQGNGSTGLPTLSTLQYVGVFNSTATSEVARQLSENPWQLLEDEEEYIWIPEAGGDVTVSLTGQSYTLSQGTHDVGLSKSVTGQSYTLSQGTLSASVSTSATVALTGQSYTLSQGSLTKGTSKALTGQSYTLSQGDLGVSTSATVALTGQSYTLSQGAFGVSAGSGSTVELTNQTYTISQGTLGVSTSAIVALTGQTYALSQGAPLPTLDLGLANQTISYTQGTLGVSVGATVALTGQIYTHTQGTLGVSVGNNVTVALTGQDLNYSQGTFAPGVALAIAGQTYSLSQGTLAVVVGNNATVALTGQSYALTQGLVGVAATVGLTGQYISFAQGTLGVTTDTNYYVSLAGQSYALTQGVLGVTNDTNYIVPLTGQSYTYSQRAPSVLGATIPTSEMRLYLVPPEDRRYTVPTY